MNLNEQYIGEEIDCEALGVGTIVEINESTVTVATDFGLAEFDLADIELDEEVEDLEEISNKTLASYSKGAARDIGFRGLSTRHLDKDARDKTVKKMEQRFKGLSKATDRLSKEEVELEEGWKRPYVKKHTDSKGNHAGWKASNKHGNVKYFGKDFKPSALKHAGLNEENLEELSKKTLGSYVKKSVDKLDLYSHMQGFKDAMGKPTQKITKKINNKMTGLNRAADRLTKEQVELEEGRGRKPKQPKEGEKPTAAWLRHLERQKGGQEKEEIEALGSQLRKAVSINKPVTFANGEKKEISNAHADKFHDHMAARKMTADKLKFQQAAHASHDAFMKAITSPIPGQ